VSRPRELEVVDCERCQVDNPHRTEHYRADRLRRKWRRQKRHQRGTFGYLHDLACAGPTACTCHPIMAYWRRHGTRPHRSAPQ